MPKKNHQSIELSEYKSASLSTSYKPLTPKQKKDAIVIFDAVVHVMNTSMYLATAKPDDKETQKQRDILHEKLLGVGTVSHSEYFTFEKKDHSVRATLNHERIQSIPDIITANNELKFIQNLADSFSKQKEDGQESPMRKRQLSATEMLTQIDLISQETPCEPKLQIKPAPPKAETTRELPADYPDLTTPLLIFGTSKELNRSLSKWACWAEYLKKLTLLFMG